MVALPPEDIWNGACERVGFLHRSLSLNVLNTHLVWEKKSVKSKQVSTVPMCGAYSRRPTLPPHGITHTYSHAHSLACTPSPTLTCRTRPGPVENTTMKSAYMILATVTTLNPSLLQPQLAPETDANANANPLSHLSQVHGTTRTHSHAHTQSHPHSRAKDDSSKNMPTNRIHAQNRCT